MKKVTFLSLTIGLITLGTVLCFWDLGHHMLWFDEIETIIPKLDPITGWILPEETRQFHKQDSSFFASLPRSSLTELPRYSVRVSSYPPLYYTAITLWRAVFDDSDAALRALSALAGSLALLMFLLLARSCLEKPATVWALLLFAIHPFLVAYFRNARPYALLVLFTTTALLLLVKQIQGSERWPMLIGLVLVNAAIAYTHHFGLFFIGAELAAILVIRPLRFRLLGCFALTALLYIPGMIILVQRIAWFGQEGHSSNWLKAETGIPFLWNWLKDNVMLPKHLLAGHAVMSRTWPVYILLALFFPALIYFIWRGFIALKKNGNNVAIIILAVILLPSLGIVATDLILKANSTHYLRYLIYVIPPLLLLAGQAAARRGIFYRGVALGLVGFFIFGLGYYFTHPWMKQDWRVIAESIRTEVGPRGYLAVDDYHHYLLLIRYAQSPLRIAWRPGIDYLQQLLNREPSARLAYIPQFAGLPDSQKLRIASLGGDVNRVIAAIPPDRFRLAPLLASGLLKGEQANPVDGAIPSLMIFQGQGQPPPERQPR